MSEEDPLERYIPTAKRYLNWSLIIAGSILLFSIIVFLWGKLSTLSFFLPSDTQVYSQYGDFIGGLLASIFSFLTFILLLYTYFNQKADSKSNKKLNENSLELIRKQNFEDTFFQMVQNLNNLISRTSGKALLHHRGTMSFEFDGAEFFEKSLQDFKMWYRKTTDNHDAPYTKIELIKKLGNENKEEKILEEFNSYYKSFYSRNNDQLGHIFRYVHNILKFSENTLKDTKLHTSVYINILQSQLSDSILALLFYNSISEKSQNSEGEYEFRQRLDKYGFFQNLRKSNVVDDYYLKFFPKTEFKNH
jgi:hypothetical protein